MLNSLIKRKSYVLYPGNIHIDFYIHKTNNNNYSLSNGLFEYIIHNEGSIEQINHYIQMTLQKYKQKGFEIKKKNKALNKNLLEKLFKIKFRLDKIEQIFQYKGKKYIYYICDYKKNINGEIKIDRHIIFFSKEMNEYIGRFTINRIDNNSMSIGSIFITPSKQRMGHFSKVMEYDVFNFIEDNIHELYAFSILKKGLGYYIKLEKEGKFEFLDNNQNSGRFFLDKMRKY